MLAGDYVTVPWNKARVMFSTASSINAMLATLTLSWLEAHTVFTMYTLKSGNELVITLSTKCITLSLNKDMN